MTASHKDLTVLSRGVCVSCYKFSSLCYFCVVYYLPISAFMHIKGLWSDPMIIPASYWMTIIKHIKSQNCNKSL